jgi:hypothetical protein
LYPGDCASGRCDGSTGKCIAAANTSGQVVGAGCLYPTDCASGVCDGATGKCVSSAPSGGGGTVSPVPSTSGGAPSTGGGSGATGSNRPPASGPSGSAPAGLHIPTSAETGLSSQSVTSLIQNLMHVYHPVHPGSGAYRQNE